MTSHNDRSIVLLGYTLISVAFFSLCLLGLGCSKREAAMIEAGPVYQPSPPSPPVKMPTVLAAKLPEVQEAVKRVFKDVAVVDTTFNPNFLAGDFNGDSSQDIAVILKPVPDKLTQMNEEPAWLLRDPLASKAEGSQLRVEKSDVLLAVIHGYGANDWRDPEATQTFLLKNVVGSDMRVRTGKEFVDAHSGRKLPRPQGDLIGGVVRGTPGYLYYAASTYSWYDPKTYKGEAERGMVHMPRTVK
jgi:hypothetical protein